MDLHFTIESYYGSDGMLQASEFDDAVNANRFRCKPIQKENKSHMQILNIIPDRRVFLLYFTANMKFLYVVLLTFLIEVGSINVSGEISLKIQYPSLVSEERSTHRKKFNTEDNTKELTEDRKIPHESVSKETYDDTEMTKENKNKHIRAIIKQTEEATDNPKQISKEDPTEALRECFEEDPVVNSTEDPIEAPTVIKNRVKESAENVTAAPVLECMYQYPEEDQVQAMLSNMMNQLTKVDRIVKNHILLINRVVIKSTRFLPE